jgi:hypothetical protein
MMASSTMPAANSPSIPERYQYCQKRQRRGDSPPIDKAPPYASPISRVSQWKTSEKILATVTAGRMDANPYEAA